MEKEPESLLCVHDVTQGSKISIKSENTNVEN